MKKRRYTCMKTLKQILVVLFAAILTTSLALAASATFKAELIGKEVVPAVETKTTGEAGFKLSMDGKELTYWLTITDIEDVTAAHIHAGKMGIEGPPVAGLYAGPKKGMYSGDLAKGTITDKELFGPLAGKTVSDLVTMIRNGEAYVNVHTIKHPGGEVRGQIK
jgi:hypothetical protein